MGHNEPPSFYLMHNRTKGLRLERVGDGTVGRLDVRTNDSRQIITKLWLKIRAKVIENSAKVRRSSDGCKLTCVKVRS